MKKIITDILDYFDDAGFEITDFVMIYGIVEIVAAIGLGIASAFTGLVWLLLWPVLCLSVLVLIMLIVVIMYMVL